MDWLRKEVSKVTTAGNEEVDDRTDEERAADAEDGGDRADDRVVDRVGGDK
jgi:hypothetical protein